MNRILLYSIIALVLLFSITLDYYSYSGIKIFKHYAYVLTSPIAVPFFKFYKSLTEIFDTFNTKVALINTIKTYANKISKLEKQNLVLQNQINVYKYIIRSYSQFSSIPILKAGLYQIKLMLNDTYIIDTSFKRAYAVDPDGYFVGIVRGNKIFSIYSKDFKCKVSINNSDVYGVLQRTAGKFVFKYFDNLANGIVYFCDDAFRIPIGRLQNEVFIPYFKFRYLPEIILLWRQ